MRELKRSRKFETVDDSLYDMSDDEYTEDEEYMNEFHPKVVSWFKNFTKNSKLWNGVEKKNIAIIEDIVDSEVVPDDIVDDCNSWVDSEYFYSLGYLDYDIIDLCKRFLSTYTYPTNENKTMRELKRSRMNENNSDVSYYDGYTKFTVPRVRDNQYNPMIVGEREELFNNILDSIDKKQTSPKYEDLFYVEGKNIDVGGGVEYRGELSHSDDDYTKVNILCELQDKKTGKVLKSFEKDLIIDYSDFMDSYDIESDIEDYILEELEKYMIGVLAQYDSKYKKENRTTRELKRSRRIEGNRRYYESL